MNSPHENPLYVTLLVVGSWLGNLLLTGIALVLAMTQGQPLTPLTFFTIAVCILLGNALPITVYYVNHLWRQAGLQAEDRLAGDTVRAALLRAEQLNERLSGLQEDAAKAVLVARQVPDRIENQLKKLDSVAVAAGKGDAGPPVEALAELGNAIKEQQSQIEDLRQALLSSTTALQEIAASLAGPAESPPEEEVVPLIEVSAAASSEVDSAPRQDTESAPESGTAEAETAQPEIPEADTEATQAAKNPPTKSNPGDEDEGLFAGVPKHNAVAADEAVIIFKGWIGSYNKLFLRGDPPHLDWEKSIQPEPLGIGEWRWRAKGVKATFKCKPILNDEHWALGPDIMVQPGKLHRVDLKF